MTYEEMQKTMQFILEHQAKHEIEIQDLRFAMKEMKENQKVFEQNQKLLQEAQHTLIATITNLALQAEADHQITQNSINAINKSMAEMREQANKDRTEMRNGMAEMREQANKDRTEMREQADRDRAEIRATVDRLSDNIDKLVNVLLKAKP
jgi:vacuolar-type H+-ATPase subunit D/Vma8